MLIRKHIKTPFGQMLMGSTELGICLFDFEYRRSIDRIVKRIETFSGEVFVLWEHHHFEKLEQQFSEYCKGTRKIFDLPLHLLGTPFQKSVWEGLSAIPYAETRSYKQQAIALGNEKAVRAVAAANGENGIAIIVPCHRVIGEDGTLTGYGGGLALKKRLLNHERKQVSAIRQMELFEEL